MKQSVPIVSVNSILEVLQSKLNTGKWCWFLDYDGTIVPFEDHPDLAIPNSSLIALLKQISSRGDFDVVITSGRSRDFLDRCFGDLPITLIANHGADTKVRGGNWRISDYPTTWKEQIRGIVSLFAEAYPQSLLEEKDYSVVWHYRNLEKEEGEKAARELVKCLENIEWPDLYAIAGKHVVEISSSNSNKGAGCVAFINGRKFDVIVAAGDDYTDEHMFSVLPRTAFTIKVGPGPTSARFRVASHHEILNLMQAISHSSP